jgi:hypothetical protein
LASASNSSLPAASGLNLTVAFDNRISSACLAVAQSALANGSQLQITGQAIVLPFIYNIGILPPEAQGSASAGTGSTSPVSSPAGTAAASGLYAGAAQQGSSIPVFYDPQVGVVFSQITSCQEIPNATNVPVTISFSQLLSANEYSTGACPPPPACDCPAGAPCACSTLVQSCSSTEVVLEGPGVVKTTPEVGYLQLTALFDLSLSPACFALAQTAASIGGQFTISGRGSPYPMAYATAAPSGGTGAPAAYEIQFNEIDSCDAATPSGTPIIPPPTPVPTPAPAPL